MKLGEFNSKFRSDLTGLYTIDEISSLFKVLLDEFLSFDITKFYLNPDYILSKIELDKINNFTNELIKGRPYQYIIGDASFYNYKFYVNESVLIPRIETEGLVDWVLKENKNSKITVVDICSGRGCIATVMKIKRNKWDIFALEINKKAIDLADLN